MPTDRYQQLTALPAGRFIAKRLGLPESRPLRRYEPGQPALAGPALLGSGPGGRLAEPVARVLATVGAEAYVADQASRRAAKDAGLRWSSSEPRTHSRVRLKSRACLSTAPATTSPTCSPARP